MNVIFDAKRMRQNEHIAEKRKQDRIYNNLHTLSRIGYSTRNKQRIGEKKNETHRNWQRKPTTMSRKNGIRKWTTTQ